MFLHVSDAVNHGYGRVMVRTVDSDVLVLAIAAVQQLSVDELWIAFGSGKSSQPMRWQVPSVLRGA